MQQWILAMNTVLCSQNILTGQSKDAFYSNIPPILGNWVLVIELKHYFEQWSVSFE